MEPLSYLHFQMKLEGIEIINGCFLRQVELVPGEKLPLILIAQFADQEWITYYDEALSSDLQRELAAAEIEFPEINHLLSVLKSRQIQLEVGHYKTYVFSSQPAMETEVLCLSKHDPRVKAFGFDGLAEQVFAIERNGALVSACVSTRENETCGEAWIYTMPEYRKQGLAQKAVRGWAGSLLSAKKVPFYTRCVAKSSDCPSLDHCALLTFTSSSRVRFRPGPPAAGATQRSSTR